MTQAASPSATGAAGPVFAGEVGASYLLSLLAEGEPCGLPGCKARLVAFQRAAQGRALDDVIVHATDGTGAPATLEIQAKRTATFSPQDPVFKSVVGQMVKTAARAEFHSQRYELAIAIEKTSTRIERDYQTLLHWIRHASSLSDLATRLALPGVASPPARTFLTTVRSHLAACGATSTEVDALSLLRRFQILIFPFSEAGSTHALLMRDRCRAVLHPEQGSQAPTLWAVLCNIALHHDAAAGDLDFKRLREILTTEHQFEFAGLRSLHQTRARIKEWATASLSDIHDELGTFKLDRSTSIERVEKALDGGQRYVEIRGESGVGKSAILKDLARQVGNQASCIVLDPLRTPAGGWPTMQAQLACPATAEELLIDLASDGATRVFVDSLEFYSPERQATIRDLLRAASKVKSVQVIATARMGLDADTTSWVPRDALDAFGVAPVVTITDLDEQEVEQLRHAYPTLRALLADSHPTKDVVRNLFRLDRLITNNVGDQVPHSEAAMAWDWWQSPPGIHSDKLERRRVIHEMAQALLESAESGVELRGLPGAAISDLIKARALRQTARSHVFAFGHEALRDWAIASLLHSEPERVSALPLRQAAPPWLSRAIQMASALSIESAADEAAWAALLSKVSAPGSHGSWRRAALMALVRSEAASEILPRAENALLADDGALLKELIRSTIALDSINAKRHLAELGVDPRLIPDTVLMPKAPSWSRLVLWVMKLDGRIPPDAIHDVAALLCSWVAGNLGMDPLTPIVLERVLSYLLRLESGQLVVDGTPANGYVVLTGAERELAQELRGTFLLFCTRTPQLAAAYLTTVHTRPRGERVAQEIMRMRGLASQAAPAAMADLTLRALIPTTEQLEEDSPDYIQGPFLGSDGDYLPASPVSGPFLELLEAAPAEGLRVIRLVVDHAATYYKTYWDAADEVHFAIDFDDGTRTFSRPSSYTWARGGDSSAVAASALMALESWGHKRLERGDSAQEVLAEVLGADGSPAAVLLVAVDLVLSNWERCAEIGWRLLGSPELLAMDTMRYARDQYSGANLDPTYSDPIRHQAAEALRAKPSRRLTLEAALPMLAFRGTKGQQDSTRTALRKGLDRLGDPKPGNRGLSDPAYAALNALNATFPENYRERQIKLDDGTTVSRMEFAPPADQQALIAPQQEEQVRRVQATAPLLWMPRAAVNPQPCPDVAVREGIKWAQSADSAADPISQDSTFRRRAFASAATLAMRTQDEAVRRAETPWARGILQAAIAERDRDNEQASLEFNTAGIACIGALALAHHHHEERDVEMVLSAAARSDTPMAYAMRARAVGITENLRRALIRVGLAGRLEPARRGRQSADEWQGRLVDHRKAMNERVALELLWLAGKGPESELATWPSEVPNKRRHIRLSRKNFAEQPERPQWPDYHVDEAGAAAWLAAVMCEEGDEARPFALAVLEHYWPWTASVNGAGLGEGEEVDRPPSRWNQVYFHSLARLAISDSTLLATALERITTLSGRALFDAIETFLGALDSAYLDTSQPPLETLLRVRRRFLARVETTRQWRWLIQSPSERVDNDLAGAICALLFHRFAFGSVPVCYLPNDFGDKLSPALPTIVDIASKAAPSAYVATMVMRLFELGARRDRAESLALVLTAWLEVRNSDPHFWIDMGVGRRACLWLQELVSIDAGALLMGSKEREAFDFVLDALTSAGVAGAAQVSETLAGR